MSTVFKERCKYRFVICYNHLFLTVCKDEKIRLIIFFLQPYAFIFILTNNKNYGSNE